jgi:hypothetical protein
MTKKLTGEKITQQWYLQKRPYKKPDEYDRYMMQIVQKVFDLLKEQPFPIQQFKLNNEQNKELAYIISGYFEDFMSEMGIWQSLRDYNRELYQSPVPVLLAPEDNYDSDYINAVDIQFLVWNFFARNYFGYAITPQFEYFFLLSESIYNILEEEIEKQMATDFFEDYLQVNEQTTFPELYDKLNWFAMASFTTGFEYRYKLGQQFLEQQKHNRDPNYLEMVHQFIKNDLILRFPSQYSALSIPQWFSYFARANETIKQQIAGMKQHIGYYKFLKSSQDNYSFIHLYSNQEYHVPKASFVDMKADDLVEGSLYQGGFVYWQNQWHLVGILIDVKEKEESENIQNYKKEGDDLLIWYEPAYRAKIYGRNQLLKEAFHQVFDDHLTFFDNGVDLQKGIEKFLTAYNKKHNVSDNKKEELPVEMKNKHDLALFFRENEGYEIAEKVNEFIDTCKKDEISEEEKMFLVKYVLFSNVSSQFILELNQRYDLKNLPSALNALFDVKRELSFFLRFYKAYDFSSPKNIDS